MLYFKNPFLLLPGLLFLLLAGLARYRFSRNKTFFLFFSLGNSGEKNFQYRSLGFSLLLFLKRAGYAGGISALLLAAAHPFKQERRTRYLSPGENTMFVLDISPSMAAVDASGENRLRKALKMIRSFVKELRENDQTGLISFGSEAALQVPLTNNHRLFLKQLSRLHISELGEGTVVNTGLAMGALHLSETLAPEESKKIILLTDGNDLKRDSNTAFIRKTLREQGIKVYTVGIGRDGRVPFRYKDIRTHQVISGFYRGTMNTLFLKELAASTGGLFFKTATVRSMTEILNYIHTLKPRGDILEEETHPVSLRFYFILWGLIALAFSRMIEEFIFKEIL